jgi:hypothetical protein
MTHTEFKQWLYLLIHDDLEDDERALLEEHLASCAECRAELADLRAFRASLTDARRVQVTDDVLQEARMELRAALRTERMRVSFADKITETLDSFLAPWAKWSLAGAATIAVGFFAGYLFSSSPEGPSGIALKAVSEDTDVTRGDARIMNVRFDDADPSDGEIEFSFDAVTPVRVKGSPNDPGIQSVLTRALITEENPGVRLRAVSAITSQIQINKAEKPASGDEVKRALIDAMKFDDNPGVRKEAMKALMRFPFDDSIKDGLLYVLSKDRSEGLRVDAINHLAAARDQMTASDEQLLDILQKKMETDNNRYVRLRARAVFEEVRRQ